MIIQISPFKIEQSRCASDLVYYARLVDESKLPSFIEFDVESLSMKVETKSRDLAGNYSIEIVGALNHNSTEYTESLKINLRVVTEEITVQFVHEFENRSVIQGEIYIYNFPVLNYSDEGYSPATVIVDLGSGWSFIEADNISLFINATMDTTPDDYKIKVTLKSETGKESSHFFVITVLESIQEDEYLQRNSSYEYGEVEKQQESE
mmetsp:Transcript_15182/g.14769  ORF Transcript_15182/g.14769 Transcript_15182/m.14769 type:complete len:207 (-) Transcript_15182:396-1016(-)